MSRELITVVNIVLYAILIGLWLVGFALIFAKRFCASERVLVYLRTLLIVAYLWALLVTFINWLMNK